MTDDEKIDHVHVARRIAEDLAAPGLDVSMDVALDDLVAAVRAEELERCARIADNMERTARVVRDRACVEDDYVYHEAAMYAASSIAAKIRGAK